MSESQARALLRALQGEEGLAQINPPRRQGLGRRVRLGQGRRHQLPRLRRRQVAIEAFALGAIHRHQRAAAAQAQTAHRLDGHRPSAAGGRPAQGRQQGLAAGGAAAAGAATAQGDRTGRAIHGGGGTGPLLSS